MGVKFGGLDERVQNPVSELNLDLRALRSSSHFELSTVSEKIEAFRNDKNTKKS
jgi:hypothetical protein